MVLAWCVLVAILGRIGKGNGVVNKHERRPLQVAKAFQSPKRSKLGLHHWVGQ